MESRQLRLLGGLTVVLGLLVAALWFGEPPIEAADPQATAVVGTSFDPARAISIELSRGSGEQADRVLLTKADGVWAVQHPFAAPADADRVFTVLRTLQGLERGIPIDGEPSSFGLDPPSVVARVGYQDGTHGEWVFGSVAPVGFRSYLRTVEGGVAAVQGNPSEELLKRVAEYRDHRIFRYDPGKVIRASITSTQGTLEASKSEDGWFLTDFGPVDLDALDAWLTEMLNLRVDLFLDLEHTQIEEAVYRVEVETSTGVQLLQVGRDTPYGKLVLFGDGLDGVIDHALLQMLERGPSDVGRAAAFPFEPTSDTQVVLTGMQEASFTQKDGEWSMTPAILDVLRDAQFVYKRTSPDPFEPVLTVRFEGQSGQRTVEIGPVDPDGFRPVAQLPGGPLRVPVEELRPLFEEY